MSTPELEPIELNPDHQARIDEGLAEADAEHKAGMTKVLNDAHASVRRISAGLGLSTDVSVYGEHCVNCDERWCLPADKATCAHMPICEDCWPNGCHVCEAEVEEDIRHREQATTRILSAALEIRTTADDLSEADLRGLDWLVRKDVQRHVALTIEALRRVHDVLNAQGASK